MMAAPICGVCKIALVKGDAVVLTPDKVFYHVACHPKAGRLQDDLDSYQFKRPARRDRLPTYDYED